MAKVVLSTILLFIISLASSTLLKCSSGNYRSDNGDELSTGKKSISQASDRCPDSWKVFGNSCYKLIAAELRWFDAQVMCKAVDSSLVIIESEKENEFVSEVAHGVEAWLGLSDVVDVGRFVSVNTQQVPTFKKWKGGRPNTNNGTYQCAYMWALHGGVWVGSDCEEKKAAICEKDPSGRTDE